MKLSHRKSERFEAAVRIADMLIQKESVEEIYLFGILTEREGGDKINLIVVVSDTDVIDYYDSLDRELIHSRAKVEEAHLEILGNLLGITKQMWCDARSSSSLPKDVEVLVLPFGWQHSLDDVSEHLIHKDPSYLLTVRDQAMRFNWISKQFS
jgi:predicted nucleotidyltransferase